MELLVDEKVREKTERNRRNNHVFFQIRFHELRKHLKKLDHFLVILVILENQFEKFENFNNEIIDYKISSAEIGEFFDFFWSRYFTFIPLDDVASAQYNNSRNVKF